MGDFDWKIWLLKGVKDAIIVGIAATLTAFAGYMQITTFPAEYTAYAGFFILVLHELANWIKHSYLV